MKCPDDNKNLTIDELYSASNVSYIEVANIDNVTDICDESVGSFSKMMAAVETHLNKLYQDNKINNDNYIDVYLQALQVVLQQSTAFELQKTQEVNHSRLQRDTLLHEKDRLAQEKDIADGALKFEYAKFYSYRQLEEDKFDFEKDIQNRRLLQEYQMHTDMLLLQQAKQIFDQNLATEQWEHQEILDNKKYDLDERRTELEEDKFIFHQYIEEAKLALEEAKHLAQLELLQAQLELQREQAKAFRYRHKQEMAQMILSLVTVGVTQEQMDILQGENKVLQTIVPKEVWMEAWDWELPTEEEPTPPEPDP